MQYLCFLQGYNKLLRDIFENAGFLKRQKVKMDLPEVTADSEAHSSLQKCTEVCIFCVKRCVITIILTVKEHI